MTQLEKRVQSLEEWRNTCLIQDAVRAEQAKHIDKRFDDLETRLDKGFTRFDGLVSRIVWLIVTALIGGVMAFILGGGLASVG